MATNLGRRLAIIYFLFIHFFINNIFKKETRCMDMNNNGSRFVRLFYLFLTGCIVGWIYEVVLGFIYGHGFVNRGFLFGPYLPVYGFGVVILHLFLAKRMAHPMRVKKVRVDPILVFLGIIIITTLLEYIVGYGMLQIFDRRWWDYSDYWMNYQGIISFNTSLRFGIGGMVFLYILVPITNKIIHPISVKTRTRVMWVIIITMIADLVWTLIK